MGLRPFLEALYLLKYVSSFLHKWNDNISHSAFHFVNSLVIKMHPYSHLVYCSVVSVHFFSRWNFNLYANECSVSEQASHATLTYLLTWSRIKMAMATTLTTLILSYTHGYVSIEICEKTYMEIENAKYLLALKVILDKNDLRKDRYWYINVYLEELSERLLRNIF